MIHSYIIWVTVQSFQNQVASYKNFFLVTAILDIHLGLGPLYNEGIFDLLRAHTVTYVFHFTTYIFFLVSY